MDIRSAIKKVTSQQHLSAEEMTAVMREIMTGATTDAQNAAFLVGLQMKGIQTEELLGGAIVMRELATPVVLSSREHLVDTCGTGGSGSNKFNVSTASALVAACAGARVAKHGNRGATSKSGSADVLEAAGVNLVLKPEQVAKTVLYLAGEDSAPITGENIKLPEGVELTALAHGGDDLAVVTIAAVRTTVEEEVAPEGEGGEAPAAPEEGE